jgi:hypothetical protein
MNELLLIGSLDRVADRRTHGPDRFTCGTPGVDQRAARSRTRPGRAMPASAGDTQRKCDGRSPLGQQLMMRSAIGVGGSQKNVADGTAQSIVPPHRSTMRSAIARANDM